MKKVSTVSTPYVRSGDNRARTGRLLSRASSAVIRNSLNRERFGNHSGTGSDPGAIREKEAVFTGVLRLRIGSQVGRRLPRCESLGAHDEGPHHHAVRHYDYALLGTLSMQRMENPINPQTKLREDTYRE